MNNDIVSLNKAIDNYLKISMQEKNVKLTNLLTDVKLNFNEHNDSFVEYALQIFESTEYDSAKYLILYLLPAFKREIIIHRLFKAFDKQNSAHIKSGILWCVSYFNCSEYVAFVSDILASINEANESAYAILEIIRNMSGPFNSSILVSSMILLLKKDFDTPFEQHVDLRTIFAQSIECYAIYYAACLSNELKKNDDLND
jgi:hypothetical protein